MQLYLHKVEGLCEGALSTASLLALVCIPVKHVQAEHGVQLEPLMYALDSCVIITRLFKDTRLTCQ